MNIRKKKALVLDIAQSEYLLKEMKEANFPEKAIASQQWVLTKRLKILHEFPEADVFLEEARQYVSVAEVKKKAMKELQLSRLIFSLTPPDKGEETIGYDSTNYTDLFDQEAWGTVCGILNSLPEQTRISLMEALYTLLCSAEEEILHKDFPPAPKPYL